jgi:hypothetical protein
MDHTFYSCPVSLDVLLNILGTISVVMSHLELPSSGKAAEFVLRCPVAELLSFSC